MNTNQFTQKTMEALQAAQRLAIEYSNQALEQEHMLVALTQQQDGLIPQLLTKMNVDPGTFETAAAEKGSQHCKALFGTSEQNLRRIRGRRYEFCRHHCRV